LDWRPFTLTRPAGELLFGTETLRARSERAFDMPCIGHRTVERLSEFDEHDSPGVLASHDSIPSDRGVLFLSSRAVPDPPEPPSLGDRPAALAIDGRVCGLWLPPGTERAPAEAFLADPERNVPADVPVRDVPGRLLERVWDLIAHNAERVERDIAAAAARAGDRSGAPTPDSVHRLGDAPLVLGRDVEIEPGVVLDLRAGPIRLDDGVRVRAFTRLAGPAYVGPGSTLLGGAVEAVSIGPVCKVHGELEETIVVGYTNKAHAGFIGHACLGRWVNLGALTTNSDLKNNYGPVRMWTAGGPVETGLTKLGCLLGDHVKTAIGTMIATGAVIGAGSNVFGSDPPPYLPPFSWGTADPSAAYDLDRFLEVAERVMARRDVRLTDRQRELLRTAWRHGRETVRGR
ncbi:MAG: putative sugar nucleotidyl transferase, partial [Gemmatimonadota bacterium]